MESRDTAPHSKRPPIRILTKEEVQARLGLRPKAPPPVTSEPASTHEGVQFAKETEQKPVFLAQHVYTHVPVWKSPQHLEGWQTYCYTGTGENALKPVDVWRIEHRLQHQHMFKSPIEPPRWQFFPLDELRVVFTRVVPRKQLDRSGNFNVQLAHSLIMRVDDLKRLPHGALSLWKDDLYSDSDYLRGVSEEIDVTGKQVDLSARKVSPADVARTPQPAYVVPDEMLKMARKMPLEELSRYILLPNATPLSNLLLLIANAKELVEKGRVVAIRGDSREVEQVLQLSLQLAHRIPGLDETALSFTTFTPGGLPYKTPFWAVGVTESIRNERAIPIDAAAVLESIKALRGNEELPVKAFERKR